MESAFAAADDGALVYTYDPVGNRMELFSTLTALPGATYTYDLNDRLNADTYDANGNTLTSNGNTFAYDFEDRLLDYNTGEVVNVYDADGNRVLRTRGASTTAYLIDELNPTGFAQVAEEITDRTVNATYALGAWRTHQVRWESGTAAPSYYGYDAHGNVRALLDANRTVTDRYEYDAFGNLLATTGTTFNSYFYTGEQFDPTMALYNLRARWYGPGAGRLATADKFEGGQCRPHSQHRYMYAEGDPVNLTDPTGFAVFFEAGEQLELLAAVGGFFALTKQVAGTVILGTATGAAVACLLRLNQSALTNAIILNIDPTAEPLTGPCTLPLSISFADDRPKPRPIPFPDIPRNPPPSDPCYAQYLADTAECALITDDEAYDRCMKHAWKNYVLCLGGFRRTPFKP